MRRSEFVRLKKDNVIDVEERLVVSILLTKTKKPRVFTIEGDLYIICKKYINLRPSECVSDRFFLRFKAGRCTQQPMGINTFGALPRKVARALSLPDAELYTGHSFRRSSATILIDNGGNMETLMRHGGWSSSKAAQGYIAESMKNKREICAKISSTISIAKKSKVSNVLKPSTCNQQHEESQILQTHSSSNEPASSFTDESSNDVIMCDSNSNVIQQKSNHHQKENQHPNVNQKDTAVIDSQNTSNSKSQSKYPVYYDPDVGLYGAEMSDDNITFVIYNSNVTLGSGSHQSVVLNHCTLNQ